MAPAMVKLMTVSSGFEAKLVAARLGIASVDVGSAMWAMHSARESAGALDPALMIAALGAGFAS